MKNEVFTPDVVDYDDKNAQRTVSPPEYDFEAAGSAVMVDEAKSTSEHSALPTENLPTFSGHLQASTYFTILFIYFRTLTKGLIIFNF